MNNAIRKVGWLRGTATGCVAVLLGSFANALPAHAAPDQRPSQHAQQSRRVKLGKSQIPGHPISTPADAKPGTPLWPSGSGEADLARPQGRTPHNPDGRPGVAAKVNAAGLPLSVAATTASSPARVKATALSRQQAVAAKRDLVIRLSRADGVGGDGQVEVTLDISGFKSAYGADWGSRLHLALLADCALSTPDKAECGSKRLATRRDGDSLTAVVDLQARSGGAALVTLASDTGESSGSGDFAATPLAPSGTWSAGGSSGGFAWQYGLKVPPPLNGPAPKIALTYSSQSVDGRMAATNNQPSWIGEGFEWSPGFIERRYVVCADDMESGANNSTKTGDLCWKTDNATVSLNGHATELIYNSADGQWHGRDEDGSKVQRLTGASNGDNDGEYWVVTSTDGIKYYFGLNRLEGWTSGKAETKSVQTVNVFGNHNNEPCHQSAFTSSDCVQAYRWNLDYVVDLHGNTMSLWWGKDTNKYGRNLSTTDLREYTRDAYLDHIDYGTHQRDLVNGTKTDTVFTAKPSPMRVQFTTDVRCLTSCGTQDSPVTANWLDTPFDLRCTGSPCDDHSPSFWSTRRLSQITTKVWDPAITNHRDVDGWTLTHSYPDPGDTTRAGMWLQKISRSGLVGGTATLPDIVFTPIMLDNRVDTALFNGLRPMRWARMHRITTESGGIIDIDYLSTECTRTNTMAPEVNTLRCYPVRWEPPGIGEIVDWFHKYVVAEVRETDATGPAAGSPLTTTTHYEYVGGGAWHYSDDDGLTKDKYRTWNQWRGYETVRTLVGVGAEQTRSETRYFRGMHGDRLNAAGGSKTVRLSDSKGFITNFDDLDEYAGMTLESMKFDSPTGTAITGSVSKPWRSDPPTAARTVGGQTVAARFTGVFDSWTWSKLDGGRPDQVTHTSKAFNSLGQTIESSEDGDINKPGDEQCVLTDFRPNPAINLYSTTSRVRTYALTCADAKQPGRVFTKDDIVGEVRTYYDNQAWDVAPVKGEVTQVDKLRDWVNDAFVPVISERTAYDAYGRPLDAWDVDGKHIGTAYTPAADGPVTSITTTHPRGSTWTTTTRYEPGWGTVVSETDLNGRVTDRAYDPLGRLLDVWKPGRSKASFPTAPSISYRYYINNTVASVVETRTLAPNGNYVVGYVFYDALLRERQTQGPTGDGSAGAVVTDTFYDSAGRMWRKYGPYIPDPGATPAPSTTLSPPPADGFNSVDTWMKISFDGAGRKVSHAEYFGVTKRAETLIAYPSGDRVETTPPLGGTAASKVTDARGRMIEFRQHKGATPATDYDRTTYDYSPTGHLIRVTNQAGTKWEYEFDIRGRESKATDPDKGVTLSTYDDAGRVLTTTDARGVVLVHTYDDLGRPEGLYNGSVAPANRLAKWGYDALATAKGMRTSSTRYVGGEAGAAYTWAITGLSAFGTPSQEKVSIPASETGLAGDYLYDMTFKPDGSPSTTRMPFIGKTTSLYLGVETLTTIYNNRGQVERLNTSLSGTSYVVGTTYTDLGEMGVVTLRNNNGPIVEIGQYYEQSSRRLSRIWTTRDTAPTTITDTNFTYDDSGALARIDENSALAGAETQCFSHDYLQRLVQAWTPQSRECQSAPATLDGPAPYWKEWWFDSAGNRTKLIDHTAGTTTKYVYPDATAAHPHSLTKTTDAADVTTANYSYDQNGNTTCRPSGFATNDCTTNSGSQVVSWDAEGRVAAMQDGPSMSSFIYGDGTRLISKDSGGKTLHLPNQDLRVNNAGTTVLSAMRLYSWAGLTIGMRAAGPTGLCWIAGDRQGSINTTVAATGSQAVAIRRQDPYGNQRGSIAGTWPAQLTRGFVGGIKDGTGLVHLGAREYDPSLGRFISVDPIVDSQDPQQLQGYSYASGSPILKSDPTGTRALEDDDEDKRRRRDQYWRDENDHTSRHHRARDAALWIIKLMVWAKGGNPDDVTIENPVPGGSKNKTGNDGGADITYVDRESGIVFVWEVKKSTYSATVATAEILSYAPHLEKKYPGMQVRPGFPLAIPPVGIVVPSPHPNELIRVVNGASPGAIMYDVVENTKLPPPPVTVPVPVPVPIPIPAPNWNRVPQPLGVPNPQPGPCGGGLACPPAQGPSNGGYGYPATSPTGGQLVVAGLAGAAIGLAAFACIAATVGVCGIVIGGGLVIGGATQLATA